MMTQVGAAVVVIRLAQKRVRLVMLWWCTCVPKKAGLPQMIKRHDLPWDSWHNNHVVAFKHKKEWSLLTILLSKFASRFIEMVLQSSSQE